MILDGPRLLLAPGRFHASVLSRQPRAAAGLVAGALTAAVLPAVAVVGGHLGAAGLGLTDPEAGLQRAAVGLLASLGGALVAAPVLALVVLWAAEAAQVRLDPREAGAAALTLLAPAWAAGVVLAVPPLLGFGPEPGEIAWAALSLVAVYRICRIGLVPDLGVRRRWRMGFLARIVLGHALLLAAVPLAPALAVRSLLGVSTADAPPEMSIPDLPLPPPDAW